MAGQQADTDQSAQPQNPPASTRAMGSRQFASIGTLESILSERAKLLGEVLPLLFKMEETPSESLLQRIALHQELGRSPSRISNVKSIKPDVAAILSAYSSGVELITDSSGPSLCPLSQAPIVVAWKGACGHLFEEQAVLDYIKRVASTCPVLGCAKRLVRHSSRTA